MDSERRARYLGRGFHAEEILKAGFDPRRLARLVVNLHLPPAGKAEIRWSAAIEFRASDIRDERFEKTGGFQLLERYLVLAESR